MKFLNDDNSKKNLNLPVNLDENLTIKDEKIQNLSIESQIYKRNFYLDNLRVFLTIVVLMHHIAISYGHQEIGVLLMNQLME